MSNELFILEKYTISFDCNWLNHTILVSANKDSICSYLLTNDPKAIVLDQTIDRYYDLEKYSIDHGINQYSINNYYTINYIPLLENVDNNSDLIDKLIECRITLNKIITYYDSPNNSWSMIDITDMARECLRRISDE